MADFEFVIDGPPAAGVNHSYKIVYHGPRCPSCGRGAARLAKEDGVGTWQEAVAWYAKAARPSGWSPARRTIVEIEWHTPRKRDADSGTKALMDGLAHGLGCDDAGFLPTVVVNEIDKTNPRTVVRVTNA